MSTTVKIVLVLIAGALFTCLAAGAVGFFLFSVTDLEISKIVDFSAQQLFNRGRMIAEYDVPAGFSTVFSADLAGYQLVGYTGEDGHSHIYFFQLPEDLFIDSADLGSEVRASFPGSTESYSNIRVVDSRPGIIAGQEVTLFISEGMNHEGEPFREISATFQGKKGQVLVVFSCPQKSWNQVEVETFLASIR